MCTTVFLWLSQLRACMLFIHHFTAISFVIIAYGKKYASCDLAILSGATTPKSPHSPVSFLGAWYCMMLLDGWVIKDSLPALRIW